MFLFALTVLVLILLIYLAIAGALVFHLKKYEVKGDLSRVMIKIFILGSILFIVLVFIVFFSINWGELSIQQTPIITN